MASAKLTESLVSGWSFPKKGQDYIYDSVTSGFGLRISRNKKVFFAEKRIRGSGATRRRTIGSWPAIKVAVARNEALKIISELARGIDSQEQQKNLRKKGLSLKRVFEAFHSERVLRPKTLADYKREFQRAFSDWLDRPWTSITSKQVIDRHERHSQLRGKASANLAFRILHAVIEYAIARYRSADDSPLIPENPARVLSRLKKWNKLTPRSSYVKPEDIARWWEAVEGLSNKVARDYLKVLILTGLRRGEALSLRWADVDFAQRTITIEQTKNGTKHVLPLSRHLIELFRERAAAKESDFVFPGQVASKPLVEVRRAVNQVQKKSGVKFSPHDLRRSFAVYAERGDISAYAIKRLLNHATGGDVTQHHYLPLDVERLRDPMECISDFVFRHAGLGTEAIVVKMPHVASAA